MLDNLAEAVDHAIVALFTGGLARLELYSCLDHVQRVPVPSAPASLATQWLLT